MTAGSTSRARSRRVEVRATAEERALIDRAVEATGIGLTEFVLTNVTAAARQVLADRTRFVLEGDALRRWEEVNALPARDLPGLRRLLARPSPFAD